MTRSTAKNTKGTIPKSKEEVQDFDCPVALNMITKDTPQNEAFDHPDEKFVSNVFTDDNAKEEGEQVNDHEDSNQGSSQSDGSDKTPDTSDTDSDSNSDSRKDIETDTEVPLIMKSERTKQTTYFQHIATENDDGVYMNRYELDGTKSVNGDYAPNYLKNFLDSEKKRPTVKSSVEEVKEYISKVKNKMTRFIEDALRHRRSCNAQTTKVSCTDDERFLGNELLTGYAISLLTSQFSNERVLLAVVTAMKEAGVANLISHLLENKTNLFRGTEMSILETPGKIQEVIKEIWKSRYEVISEIQFAALVSPPLSGFMTLNKANPIHKTDGFTTVSNAIRKLSGYDEDSRQGNIISSFRDADDTLFYIKLSENIAKSLDKFKGNTQMKMLTVLYYWMLNNKQVKEVTLLLKEERSSNLNMLLLTYLKEMHPEENLETVTSKVTLDEDAYLNVLDQIVGGRNETVQEKIQSSIRTIELSHGRGQRNRSISPDAKKRKIASRSRSRSRPTYSSSTRQGRNDVRIVNLHRSHGKEDSHRPSSRERERGDSHRRSSHGQDRERGSPQRRNSRERGYDTATTLYPQLTLPERKDLTLLQFIDLNHDAKARCWKIQDDVNKLPYSNQREEALRGYDKFEKRVVSVIASLYLQKDNTNYTDDTKSLDAKLKTLQLDQNIFHWIHDVTTRLFHTAQIHGTMGNFASECGGTDTVQYLSIQKWMMRSICGSVPDHIQNQCGGEEFSKISCPMVLLKFIQDKLKTDASLVYILKCFVSGAELKPGQSPVALMAAMTRDYKVLVKEFFHGEQMKMFTLVCYNRLNQDIKLHLRFRDEMPKDSVDLNKRVMDAYNSSVTTSTNVNIDGEKKVSSDRRDQQNRNNDKPRRNDDYRRDDRRNSNRTQTSGDKPKETRHCYGKDKCTKPNCEFIHPEGFKPLGDDKQRERRPS